MVLPTDLVGHEPLRNALATARAFGFLGPGPLEDHITHAGRFLAALGPRLTGRAVDLGAGGGLPGLVLALARPEVRWAFLDANQRRTAALREAVHALDLGERVDVHTGRAEEFGQDADHRGAYNVVVARSFGPPAVVAECAAPLLQAGGHLAVSEPPDGGVDRWPTDGLALLGLTPAPTPDPGIFVARCQEPAGDRYPRRTGIPSKRPLF